METYISKYIDLAVIVISFILTFVLTIRLFRRSLVSVRGIPLYFLLLGTTIIGCAMAAHLFEIGFRAIQQAIRGDFVYTYHFYSLMLMGIVFMNMSGFMLQQVNAWILGNRQGKVNFIKAAVLMSLLTAPTYFFAPIGLLPTVACVISLAAIPFAVKKPKAVPLVLENA